MKKCAACGTPFKSRRASHRYCSRLCSWQQNGGQNKKPESWWTNEKGYVEGRIWLPDGTKIRVKKHRFIMEGILGRPLLPNEDVHHINDNKADNSPGNLQLISHGKHSTLSNKSRLHKRGYQMNLSDEERKARSLRAIAQQLNEMGRAAIAKAEGK